MKEYFDWQNPISLDDYKFQEWILSKYGIEKLLLLRDYFDYGNQYDKSVIINDKIKKEYDWLFESEELG